MSYEARSSPDLAEFLESVDLLNENKKLEEENRRLRETLSLHDPNDSIKRTLSSCQMLKLALETAFNLIRPEAAVLFLRDSLTGRYEVRDFRASMPLPLDAIIGDPDLLAIENVIRRNPYILADGDRIKLFFRNLPSYRPLRAFFAIPIQSEKNLFGFINVYQFEKINPVTMGQATLLSALANRVADALTDTNLLADLRSTFQKTIEMFASALEKKDSYTAGHSNRTVLYASMMCDGLKLPKKECELVIEASRLHDIGKINVDLTSLNNPGKLTDHEIERFRSHPKYGRQILEPIFFFSDLVPLVYHHHENFDGSGYPDGIKNGEIPLGARIIAIADAYDAMTSHRAYRRALFHDRAVSELTQNAGTQFDPQLVEVFVEEVKQHLDEDDVLNLLRNLKD